MDAPKAGSKKKGPRKGKSKQISRTEDFANRQSLSIYPERLFDSNSFEFRRENVAGNTYLARQTYAYGEHVGISSRKCNYGEIL